MINPTGTAPSRRRQTAYTTLASSSTSYDNDTNENGSQPSHSSQPQPQHQHTQLYTQQSQKSQRQLSSSNLQSQSPKNDNNCITNLEDWNIIGLIIICALFLILQSFGFRNVAIHASGRWSPYNTINHHPSWCPYASCNNTPRCKPCQRRFLIVIATGRSGSTTLMNLFDLLPGVRMAGENKGQLLNDFHSYFNLRDSIEFEFKSTEGVEGAWKHFPIPEQSLSCPIQGIYEAINPPPELTTNYHGNYDDSNMVLGFKTVRLHQALDATNSTEIYLKWNEFLTHNFPCAKYIFNIRGDIEKQVQSWLLAFGTQLDGDKIRDYNQKLSQLAATLGPERARVIDMSEWSKEDGSGLPVLNDLVDWLGFRDCKFTSLIHSNKDGYGKDGTKLSLGKKCILYGT